MVSVVTRAPGGQRALRAIARRRAGRTARLSMRTVASTRVSSGRVISSTPALAPKVVSGWVGPEQVDQAAADGVRRWPAWRPMTMPSRIGQEELRRPSAVAQVGSTRSERSPGPARRRRHGCFSGWFSRSAARSATASMRRRRCSTRSGGAGRAPARGRRRRWWQKGDDQHRNRAPQQRLGGQQPPIRRLGDRLREAFDGIRVCRRTRHTGARHGGLRSEFPLHPRSEGCAASSPNHLPIGIDGG